MRGMNRNSGLELTNAEHIKQSIHDLLTTPIGSRVMLRDYGSRLPDLVDEPINDLLDVELYAAVAEALKRWEPRFELRAVWISGRTNMGRITFGISGVVVSDGSPIRLEGITL